MTVHSCIVVQQDSVDPPGLLTRWAEAVGVTLEVRHPYSGDPLPDAEEITGGVIVLGGRVGPYDDARHPWLFDLKRLLTLAVAWEIPLLAIAGGAHVLTVALGGQVTMPSTPAHIGLTPLRITQAGGADPLLHAVPDGTPWVTRNPLVPTTLPDGAILLATDDHGHPQAARYGYRAWGFHGHPEADHTLAAQWQTTPDDSPAGAKLHADPLPVLYRHGDDLAAVWSSVLAAFFAVDDPR